MAKLELDRLERHIGAKLLDCRGKRVGRVDEVYINEATGAPEWIRVPVGPLGTRSTLVPVERLEEHDGDLVVAHDRACVKAAPVYLEPHGGLPASDEARLFEYHDLPSPEFGGAHAAVPHQ